MTNRYYSLDVFRGLTIAGMILVNTSGHGDFTYAPLRHAAWHGFTPTDWVFPSFLFIVGVAMRFSFKAYGYQLTPVLRTKILRRTAIIFALGWVIFLPIFWEDGRFRVLGVLQRIALSYAAAAFLVLKVDWKYHGWLVAGLLVGYWILLATFGDYDLTTNAVRKLDLWLFGPDQLYHGDGVPFDPEGLLSTLPAIATVLLGYRTGIALQETDDRNKLIVGLVGAGVVLCLAALAWNVVFPINKKLWTSSFVLLTAGLDLLLLPVLIWAIDVKGYRGWTAFFVVFGLNSIVAYAVSELLAMLLYAIPMREENGYPQDLHSWVYWHVFQPVFGNYAGALAWAVAFVGICWLACYALYRKKLFLKV
jgi:predicted acyltransferase